MDDRGFYMWLGRINGMNIKRLYALMHYFGSEKDIYNADSRELSNCVDSRFVSSFLKARKEFYPEQLEEDAEKCGVNYVTMFDKNFPEPLKTIDEIPIGLYYKGILPDKNSRLVSMIGSRRCTEYGRLAAMKISKELAENGVTVVSGLATGIDSYSNEGALNAKGITGGIFGTAIDKIYPEENRGLVERIIDNGGFVMSEYGVGQKTFGHDFLRRNRLIAGISEILVVVEAEIKSGTNTTVNDALNCGKSIYAVPGSIFSKFSEGTNALIRDGCTPLLDVQDILLEMRIDNKKVKDSKKDGSVPDLKDVSENGRKIVAALTDEGLDFDSIASKTGIDGNILRSELTILEIRKIIMKLPGQRYRPIL